MVLELPDQPSDTFDLFVTRISKSIDLICHHFAPHGLFIWWWHIAGIAPPLVPVIVSRFF
jgi:hypothetical protein